VVPLRAHQWCSSRSCYRPTLSPSRCSISLTMLTTTKIHPVVVLGKRFPRNAASRAARANLRARTPDERHVARKGAAPRGNLNLSAPRDEVMLMPPRSRFDKVTRACVPRKGLEQARCEKGARTDSCTDSVAQEDADGCELYVTGRAIFHYLVEERACRRRGAACRRRAKR